MGKTNMNELARQKGIGTGHLVDGIYRPIMDWTMVPGARVSEERLQDLMTFNFESYADLSLDDMIACHSRKGQAVLWNYAAPSEKLFGVENTEKLYYELGHTTGEKGWKGVLKHFNTDKLTPAQVAWYQDMAHFFYGPHCQAYTEYTEDTVYVTRTDCFVSMPPKGFENAVKYVKPYCEGYLDAYRELSPYLYINQQFFIGKDEMQYEVDLNKYPSFCHNKRAGQPFHTLIFKWIK